ncbi:hypothetical protein LTR95_009184, partial [Oleoguttula sp. CCFEE 5521]
RSSSSSLSPMVRGRAGTRSYTLKPHQHREKAHEYHHQEAKIERVIAAMKAAGGPIVVTQWAKEHDLSYQVLNKRFRDKSGPLHTRKPPHLRLSTAQELALVRYAEQRDATGLALPLKVLSTVAN